MTSDSYPSHIVDALVVGAGPAGSWTARRLAERGADVVLADENQGGRGEIVCTGIVGSEAWQRFELPESSVRAVVARADFVSPCGRVVPYEPESPFARVVDRVAFDHALAETAREAGARLLPGWAARGVEKGPDRVSVRFETPGGERRLSARALVVATGHQRWLHEASGLGTPEDYVHGVHADVPFRDLDGAELYFGNELAPGFFAWAIPFSDGTARLGVLAPQRAHLHFDRFLDLPAIRDRLDFDLGAEGGAEEALGAVRSRLRSRAIVQGPVQPSVADRVLAVGEAAGQVKTTTAGGIYYGLQGAEHAAEVLAGALEEEGPLGGAGSGASGRDARGGGSGPLSAESLAAYDVAWREALMPEIEAGLELQRAVRDLEDREIDQLFEALQGGLGAMVRAALRFDWHRPALQILFRHDRAREVLGGRVA